MAPQTNIDKEIDRLYGLPLDEFTPARNRLARDLKKAGAKKEADEVAKLKKPSVSAWAVNQLRRHERMNVRALLTVSDQLAKAQRRLLAGRGQHGTLEEASDRQTNIISTLTKAAKRALTSGGHPATDATLDRIARTLRAVAVDEDGREKLKRGRLTEDLDPAGFGGLFATPLPQRGKRETTRARESRKRRDQLEPLKTRVSKLRADVQERKRAAREADQLAAEARRRVEALEEKAEGERVRLQQAEAGLAEAEGKLARARRG
jgi:hypothetical protein